ncbi:hypothetical protein B0H14DRAFT_2773213 [Mycena olivaceomarginata]|nr:hypothetical protein B0H14DRAFT_2773213 [Mycena olivaceomarginata]
MGRWTQEEEDSSRLPEGVKRIGYDADTARYKFCDREGNLYLGPPHEHYGQLTVVGKTSHPATPADDRPNAFASPSDSRPELSVEVPVRGQGTVTFHDFVPAHLIASPSSAESTFTPSPLSGEVSAAGSRFRDAVRRTALPSMANVVSNVRRSATMLRKREPKAQDREEDGLLRSGSKASSQLTRSNTTTTTATSASVAENELD